MAEPKTKPTKTSITTYLTGVTDPDRRRDARTLITLMKRATGKRPVIWGTAIVGFGARVYQGSGGKSASWPVLAFALRANALTIYLMTGFGPHQALMRKLGKFKTGKGCLYLRRLEDVDVATLGRILTAAAKLQPRNAAA